MSLQEILMMLARYQLDSIGTSERQGQALSRCLSLYSPRLLSKLESADIDPFNNDELIPAFYTAVAALWDDRDN